MKKSLTTFAALVSLVLTSCAPLHAQPEAAAKSGAITDYDSCVAAGNVVLRSFPPKCVTKDGQMFRKVATHMIDGKICKDQCGDGTCQEIVCQASGCPCAETPENCAKDCAPQL